MTSAVTAQLTAHALSTARRNKPLASGERGRKRARKRKRMKLLAKVDDMQLMKLLMSCLLLTESKRTAASLLG